MELRAPVRLDDLGGVEGELRVAAAPWISPIASSTVSSIVRRSIGHARIVGRAASPHRDSRSSRLGLRLGLGRGHRAAAAGGVRRSPIEVEIRAGNVGRMELPCLLAGAAAHRGPQGVVSSSSPTRRRPARVDVAPPRAGVGLGKVVDRRPRASGDDRKPCCEGVQQDDRQALGVERREGEDVRAGRTPWPPPRADIRRSARYCRAPGASPSASASSRADPSPTSRAERPRRSIPQARTTSSRPFVGIRREMKSNSGVSAGGRVR